MKAVISVTGKDSVGIIHKVSEICAKYGVNIAEISQSVLQDFFAMIMVVDIAALTIPFGSFVDEMTALGKANALEIHTMHEDIFNAMHRI
ncbi:MAG: ACT domain-containing protein [Clostridia bacterium]|nr:ACT domain-containing protein [Clostridia bacterium]